VGLNHDIRFNVVETVIIIDHNSNWIDTQLEQLKIITVDSIKINNNDSVNTVVLALT